MLTVGKLIELALGPEEAKHVDTAIPQHVFDSQYPGQREQNAGWYYDRTPGIPHSTYVAGRSITGRLLTKNECWDRIKYRLESGELAAHLGAGEDDVAYVVKDWPCFHYHVERGEIVLEEANVQANR